MKENVIGFPGYHVTKDGKVYSCLIKGGSNRKGPWVLKKTYVTDTGHERIVLCNSSGVHSTYVSRLVVMHLDDIGTHNHVDNLKWGTHKENTWDSINKGRWSNPPYGSGLDSPRSLLKSNVRKQRRIIRLSSLGFNYKDIGLKVRLSPKVISRYLRIRNSLE